MHLKAENLLKKYGSTRALDNLSWELAPGQVVAILGPNGAGKTTLLNALTGCLRLDGGRVLFDGEVYGPNRTDLRQRFAFIPDVPPVPAGWSPVRFIGSLVKLYGKTLPDLEDRVVNVLRDLDLLGAALWKFRQLSRGQAYKAALAGFLVADPELWFVDEPFASGMDPRGLNTFKQYARGAAARGHTIVFTTQIIEVAEQIADRICVINKGLVKADATPAELSRDSAYEQLLAELHETAEPRANITG
jgi:ABC-type multidrug transport system ATPase subunit